MHVDDQMKRLLQRHRAAWEQEHRVPTLLGMAGTTPSVSVNKLQEYMIAHPLIQPGTKVLDIGCGKGRNALFLAQQGFRIVAFDLVEAAIIVLQERARDAGLVIDARVGAMDEPWPYADGEFDLVLDDTASMSIGYAAGRAICRDECFRVLRPGGSLVNYTLARGDAFLSQFPQGKEEGTVITPDGKIEWLASLEELEAREPRFHLLHQEHCWKQGTTGSRQTIWSLFQKTRG